MRKLMFLAITLSLTAMFSGLWAQSRVLLVVIASEGPAQVILSGRLVGVANPRLTTQVAPGNYELLVRKPGLPEFRQRITVGSGGLTIDAPLGGAAIQPIQPIQPAPQAIQPIQPAPQTIQTAPQPPTLQQPQTMQPAPQPQAPASTSAPAGGRSLLKRHTGVLNDQNKEERIPIQLMHNGNLELAIKLDSSLNFEGIRVLDSDGKTAIDAVGPGSHTSFNSYRLRAGTYSIYVQKDTRGWYQGSYTMEIYFDAMTPWNDHEPDNDRGSARGLAPDSVVQSALGYRGQGMGDDNDDWYQLRMDRPSDIQIQVSNSGRSSSTQAIREGDGSLNLYGGIFLYDADGSTSCFYSRQSPGEDKSYDVKNLPAGTYYIKMARDTRPMYWGTYTLKVSGSGMGTTAQAASPSTGGQQAGASSAQTLVAAAAYQYQFIPLSGLTNLRAAVRGPDRFIIAGDGGTPYSSTDGRSWQAGSKLPLYNVVDLVWGNGLYVAVGDGGRLATSPDGVNWTSRTSGISRHLASALWTGSQYLVTGQGGTLLTSRDGASWTAIQSGVSSHLMAVSQDREGGTLAIVTIEGTILYSKNGGQSWQRSSVGLGAGTIHNLGGGPHGFVVAASSADGRVFHSPDGVNWNQVYQGDGKTGHGPVFWDGANYLIGGSGYVLVSPDGVSWAKVAVPQNKPAGKSATGNGVLITVSADGSGVMVSSASAMASAPARPPQGATPATPAVSGVSPAVTASPVPTAPRSPSAKGWKSLGPIKSYQGTPGWGITFLAELRDGTLAVASEGAKEVMWSEDNGKTWVERTPREASGGYARALAVAPDGSLYYPVTYAGLFRTTDKGKSWTKVDPVNTIFSYFTIVSSGTLFAVFHSTFDTKLYRSTDGGRTWSVSHSEYPLGTISEAPDGTLYATYIGGKGIHNSRDDGRTWTKTAIPSVFSDNSMVFSGNETLVHSLSFVEPRLKANTYQYSTGNGRNWNSGDLQFLVMATDKAGDVYGIEMRSIADEYFSKHLIRSTDGGKTFAPFTGGFTSKDEPYRMFRAPFSGNIYVSNTSLFVLE